MSEKSKSKKTPKKHISSESEPKSKKSRKTKKPKAKSKIKRAAAPAEESPADSASKEESSELEVDNDGTGESFVPTEDFVPADSVFTEDFVLAGGSIATDEDSAPAEEFAFAEDSVPTEDFVPADSVFTNDFIATDEDSATAEDSAFAEEFASTEDLIPAEESSELEVNNDGTGESHISAEESVPAEDSAFAEEFASTEDLIPAEESPADFAFEEESSELEVNNDGTGESHIFAEESVPIEDSVPADSVADESAPAVESFALVADESSASAEDFAPESLSASASSSSADVISGESAVQAGSEAGEKSADASRSEKNGQTHTLRVSSLYKMFGKKTVVQGVEFKMETGEVLGLLGPNGAGKTTTFYMIVGFHRPTSGEIFLDDERITGLPMYKRARLGISYLPQEPSVFRKLTVEENIWSILETRKDLSRAEKRQRLDELIEEFSIGRIRKQHAFTLSGGERRRTEIARSLAIEPKFLLLDEPFAGIDPIAVADIKDMIKLLAKRGIGVLITDHNVRDTLEITERAIIISTGQIVVQGNKDDILASPVARKIYLGEDFSM